MNSFLEKCVGFMISLIALSSLHWIQSNLTFLGSISINDKDNQWNTQTKDDQIKRMRRRERVKESGMSEGNQGSITLAIINVISTRKKRNVRNQRLILRNQNKFFAPTHPHTPLISFEMAENNMLMRMVLTVMIDFVSDFSLFLIHC